MKNTVALAWGDRVVVSPHIGDMGTPRSLAVFDQLVADLQALYGVRAEVLVHDAHPGYATTRWAARQGLPTAAVLHHHAHASALAGEIGLEGPCLVFTWDGVGYGEDGSLWGGEALLGRPGAWRRVATFRPFRLPGGERAGREPWRSAASLCWTLGRDWPGAPAGADLAREAWARGLNAPETSAVGRLFDAAAALTGTVLSASFEGQGPMWLEAVAVPDARGPDLPLTRRSGLWVADWAPLVDWLTAEGRPVEERAGGLHDSLARLVASVAITVREETGVTDVGLCGGVFQNRLLTEQTVRVLGDTGFRVHLAREVPVNDGGISFGQVVEYAATTGS
jgi:hydrogenase maturation protein HypF